MGINFNSNYHAPQQKLNRSVAETTRLTMPEEPLPPINEAKRATETKLTMPEEPLPPVDDIFTGSSQRSVNIDSFNIQRGINFRRV